MDAEQIRPMPGWCLCRLLEPKATSESGLYMGRDMEDGKTGEAVATVLRVTPKRSSSGKEIDPGFGPGDRIVFREFLKSANTVGSMVGESRDDRVFLLNVGDALAVVPEGETGTLGLYGEFQL